MKRILVTSTQYPGYGGAATNSYAIIKYLRQNGFDAIGVFFENTRVNVDPDRIGGVIGLELRTFLLKKQLDKNTQNATRAQINALFKDKQDPDIIISKNFLAPVYARLIFPKCKNIFFLTGISCFTEKMIPIDDVMNGKSDGSSRDEIDAINHSDCVVLNSKLTFDLFNKIYPQFRLKTHPNPIDTTKCIQSIIPVLKSNKIYDFIVISSRFDRKVKNGEFSAKLLGRPEFNSFSKIIIGDNPTMFKNIPNVQILGLISHAKTQELLSKSKVLIFPSTYDANPNTVREAVANKNLALVSNKIGFYERFPDFSVVNNFSEIEWSNKALHMINNYDTIIKDYNIDFSLKNGDIIDFLNNFL